MCGKNVKAAMAHVNAPCIVPDMIEFTWAIGFIQLFRSTSMSTIMRGTNLFLFVLFCTATGILTSYGTGEYDFHAVDLIGLNFLC